MSIKPRGKDDYGLPLGSNKASSSINKAQDGSQLESNKVSSSISLRPFSSITLRPLTPTKPTSTLAEIIKSPPQIPNPLIPSNIFTPLYYQNVLVSPKDFTSRTPIPTDSPKSIPSDEYLEKTESMSILILEKAWITPNPRQIAENLFPRDFHYLPIDLCKPITFYEFILVDTKSIEISHQKDDEGNIQFSKIKILQVLTP